MRDLEKFKEHSSFLLFPFSSLGENLSSAGEMKNRDGKTAITAPKTPVLEHTEPHNVLKPTTGSQLCSRSLPKAWTFQHQLGLVLFFHSWPLPCEVEQWGHESGGVLWGISLPAWSGWREYLPNSAWEHQPCPRSWHVDHAAVVIISWPSHRELLFCLWIVSCFLLLSLTHNLVFLKESTFSPCIWNVVHLYLLGFWHY